MEQSHDFEKKREKKEKKNKGGGYTGKKNSQGGNQEDKLANLDFAFLLAGRHIPELVLVDNMNGFGRRSDALDVPFQWIVMSIVLKSFHQVKAMVRRCACDVHDALLKYLTLIVSNRAGVEKMVFIVD